MVFNIGRTGDLGREEDKEIEDLWFNIWEV